MPEYAASSATATRDSSVPFLLVLCTAGAAGLGALASVQAGDFYLSLVRPMWAPPAWVFGPVWTALYTLMAVAAWRVWRARGRHGVRHALTLYVVQLAANALWPWLFFAWRQGAAAFVEAVVLAVLVATTMRAFWRVRRGTALLLLPYLLWVGFASALTWAVWQNNPAKL